MEKKDNKDILSHVINNEQILNPIVNTLLFLSSKENNLPINSFTIKETSIKKISDHHGQWRLLTDCTTQYSEFKTKTAILNKFLNRFNVVICILNEIWLKPSDFFY